MSKIGEYLKDTKGELKHVIWPSRKQTFFFTLTVIILSIGVAYFLGLFDFLFSRGIGQVLK
jgi:preprotein translocase subunit SecE